MFRNARNKLPFDVAQRPGWSKRSQQLETSCKSYDKKTEIPSLNVKVSRFVTQEAYFVLAHVV